jgi:hypothetical protein
MTDFPPNELSHLSDEQFNALAPQGYHATGLAEALSPAAQAVLDAMYQVNMDFSGENAQLAAAALRAAADQVVPEESGPCCEGDEYQKQWESDQSIRAHLLAIAAELDNNSTHK